MELGEPYWYKAEVVSVYDGDTVTATFQLGFNHVMKNQKIRLYGINTPEMRGDEKEQGRVVRDYVRSLCLGKDVLVKTHKDKSGKFGRWLAQIYIGDMCLNDHLIEKGYAVSYTP